MNQAQLLRALAESTVDFSDDEREGLWNCIAGDIQRVHRVRRLKAEAGTLPPPPASVPEARGMLKRGELPAAVSFDGVPEHLTRCDEPEPPPHPCMGCEYGVPVRDGRHEEETDIPNTVYSYPCLRTPPRDQEITLVEVKT